MVNVYETLNPVDIHSDSDGLDLQSTTILSVPIIHLHIPALVGDGL